MPACRIFHPLCVALCLWTLVLTGCSTVSSAPAMSATPYQLFGLRPGMSEAEAAARLARHHRRRPLCRPLGGDAAEPVRLCTLQAVTGRPQLLRLAGTPLASIRWWLADGRVVRVRADFAAPLTADALARLCARLAADFGQLPRTAPDGSLRWHRAGQSVRLTRTAVTLQDDRRAAGLYLP